MKAIGPMTRSAPTGAAHGKSDADPAMAEAFAALIAAALGTKPAVPPSAPSGTVATPSGTVPDATGKAATLATPVLPAATPADAAVHTASPLVGTAVDTASPLVGTSLPGPTETLPPAAKSPIVRSGAAAADDGGADAAAADSASEPDATAVRPPVSLPRAASTRNLLHMPAEAVAAPPSPADQPPGRPGTAVIGAAVAGVLALEVGDQHRPSPDPTEPPVGLTVAPHAAATQITAPAAPPVPPAPGPGAQPAVETVPDQLVRVLMPLRGAADGEYTVSLRLRPAELGDVTVLVSVRDGVLSVALRGNDTAANHVLQDALPDLHHQLRSDGIRVGDLGLLPLTPAVAAQPGQHAGQTGQQFPPSGNQAALQLGQPDRQGQQGQQGQPGQQGSQFGGNGHPDRRRAGTAEAGTAGSSRNPVQPGRRDTGHSVLRRAAGTAVLDVDI